MEPPSQWLRRLALLLLTLAKRKRYMLLVVWPLCPPNVLRCHSLCLRSSGTRYYTTCRSRAQPPLLEGARSYSKLNPAQFGAA